MSRVSRQNCHIRKFCSLLPKTALKLFFQKTRFWSVFTKLPPSPIFGAKRTMWRVSRRNCHRRKLRLLLPKTAPKSFFWKTRFLFVFMKRPPQLFLGPNGQCEVFRDEIVMDENFACFGLKQPQNLFSKKHVSCQFLRNRPLTYSWGQTDNVTCFEAKLSRSKTSLAFV